MMLTGDSMMMTMVKDFWQWPNVTDWMPFGSRSRYSRFFESGEVRLALLSLLEERPKHGYELIKDLEARSGGLYRASAGAVYPTLQQLEDEGFVVSKTKEGKRVYSLTEAGTAELKKNADSIRRIWQRAETWEDWSRWMSPEVVTILGPIGELVKSAMQAIARGRFDPDRIAHIREIIQQARQQVDVLDTH